MNHKQLVETYQSLKKIKLTNLYRLLYTKLGCHDDEISEPLCPKTMRGNQQWLDTFHQAPEKLA